MSNPGGSSGATLAIRAEARGRVIPEFSYQHFKAATSFRDRLVSLQEAHLGQAFASFFGDIRSYGSACIMSSAAGLEALINECFITPAWPLRRSMPDFESEFWGARGIERLPLLEKYQRALRMLGLESFNEHEAPYREAWALVELRNALVHYKPTWDPERRRQVELREVLEERYEPSPFVDDGADFVTMKSMSADAMRWVTATAFSFVRDFHVRTQFGGSKMELLLKLDA